MISPNLVVARGDVWEVRFDPSEGDEIKKVRPAVVMTMKEAGRMRLQIVVPITTWQPQFARYFWMVPIPPSLYNGLSRESAADAFQVKSLSLTRFQNKLGVLSTTELDAIATAITLCIGYKLP